MGKRNVKSRSGIFLTSVAACLLVSGLFSACAAQKGDVGAGLDMTAEVVTVDVVTEGEADRVLIATNPESITYNVYKWMDPDRVVVDLTDALPGQIPETIPVADGLIQEVEVKKIEAGEDMASSLVRVIINLAEPAQYEVSRDDGKLVVSVARQEKGEEDLELVFDTSGLLMVEQGDSLKIASPADKDWMWGGPDSGEKSSAAVGNARKLMGISYENESELTRVNVRMDGAVGDYSAFTLDNPSRLVVDLWGIDNQAKIKSKAINQQGILRVRAGQHPDKLRLVFDASPGLPNFRFDKVADKLVISFSRTMDLTTGPEMSASVITETAGEETPGQWPLMSVAQAGGSAAEWGGIEGADSEWGATAGGTDLEWAPPTAPLEGPTAPAPAGPTPAVDWGPTPAAPAAAGKAEVGVAYIDSVKFDYSNDSSSIIIHGDRKIRREQWAREDNPEEKIVSIFLSEAQVAADQQRSYDTTEFQSPIELFSVFQRPNQKNEVAIVIVMREWAASKWNDQGNKLVFQFENAPGSLGVSGAPTTGMFGPRGEEITGGPAMPGAELGAPEAMVAPGAAPQYTGATVNLDFKDLDIRDALRTIADVSGMNIIISDDVKGTITIKLENVPWDQALDIILETKELGKVESGNIIRIAQKSKLEKEKADRLASLEAERKYEQLTVQIIPINYLKAAELKTVVNPILTPGRGKADVHQSTNSLIVRDIPKVVGEVRDLVLKLDRPTKQVLIEARIVEATVGVTREIGVQWGTNIDIGPATGTPTGLNFPNTIQVGGAVLGAGSGASGLAGISQQGGAIGMTVGSLTDVVDLDVALRALEAKEKVKIISSPRVLTLTDQTAIIQQGISIPYPPPALIGAAAVGWTFVEATLQLQVTPHVAADNSIIMDVKAANNEPVSIAGSDRPGISRKETTTTILLNDGETAVIGGIFKITRDTPKTQVPFLGELPLIGWMFQDRIIRSKNEEMLIFLTPRIIHPGTGAGESLAGVGLGAGM